MATTLTITSRDSAGKKLQQTVTHVNPAATNALLKALAEKINALTTNVYQSASRVDKEVL